MNPLILFFPIIIRTEAFFGFTFAGEKVIISLKKKAVKIYHYKDGTMYTIDFDKPIHIHFIGIGGISMSGLAEILLEEGFSISGSDARESALTEHLSSLGARINLWAEGRKHYG